MFTNNWTELKRFICELKHTRHSAGSSSSSSTVWLWCTSLQVVFWGALVLVHAFTRIGTSRDDKKSSPSERHFYGRILVVSLHQSSSKPTNQHTTWQHSLPRWVYLHSVVMECRHILYGHHRGPGTYAHGQRYNNINFEAGWNSFTTPNHEMCEWLYIGNLVGLLHFCI